MLASTRKAVDRPLMIARWTSESVRAAGSWRVTGKQEGTELLLVCRPSIKNGKNR
jgi:hypothetical protein